jgi:nucleoside 2-deoxyribosyltransferase
MRLYFSSSIKGSLSINKEEHDKEIIAFLKHFGEVLAGHLKNGEYEISFQSSFNDKEIHDRDMNWLLSSDAVIAEVSNPSLGVGYEIGRAVEHNIPVLCLYHKVNKKLSTMMRGCDKIIIKDYYDSKEAEKYIDEFIVNIKNHR